MSAYYILCYVFVMANMLFTNIALLYIENTMNYNDISHIMSQSTDYLVTTCTSFHHIRMQEDLLLWCNRISLSDLPRGDMCGLRKVITM